MSGTTINSRAPGRIDAVDFVKGALVVFMVVYHALNYSAWRNVPGQFLAFLPPSFIFLAGFLLTNVYTGKYRNGGWPLYRRLLVRGFKLVVIFTALNVGGNAVFTRNYSGQDLGLASFFREFQATFVFGNTRTASFEILLPIGYLLAAAPLFLRAHFANKNLVATIAACMFVACVAMELAGFAWSVAQMFTVGVIGMAAGQAPLEKWDALGRRWPLVLLAYGAHWVLNLWLGQMYLVQTIAACVSVLLIYAVAIRLEGAARPVALVNCLGRYSLFSYILQIAVLQVFYRTSWFGGATLLSLVCMGCLTLGCTWAGVCALDFIRLRSRPVDRLYRFVFA